MGSKRSNGFLLKLSIHLLTLCITCKLRSIIRDGTERQVLIVLSTLMCDVLPAFPSLDGKRVDKKTSNCLQRLMTHCKFVAFRC